MLSKLSSKFSSKFSSILKEKNREPIQKQCNKDTMVHTIIENSNDDSISDNGEYNFSYYIPKYKKLLRFYKKIFNSKDTKIKIKTYIIKLSALFTYISLNNYDQYKAKIQECLLELLPNIVKYSEIICYSIYKKEIKKIFKNKEKIKLIYDILIYNKLIKECIILNNEAVSVENLSPINNFIISYFQDLNFNNIDELIEECNKYIEEFDNNRYISILDQVTVIESPNLERQRELEIEREIEQERQRVLHEEIHRELERYRAIEREREQEGEIIIKKEVDQIRKKKLEREGEEESKRKKELEIVLEQEKETYKSKSHLDLCVYSYKSYTNITHQNMEEIAKYITANFSKSLILALNRIKKIITESKYVDIIDEIIYYINNNFKFYLPQIIYKLYIYHRRTELDRKEERKELILFFTKINNLILNINLLLYHNAKYNNIIMEKNYNIIIENIEYNNIFYAILNYIIDKNYIINKNYNNDVSFSLKNENTCRIEKFNKTEFDLYIFEKNLALSLEIKKQKQLKVDKTNITIINSDIFNKLSEFIYLTNQVKSKEDMSIKINSEDMTIKEESDYRKKNSSYTYIMLKKFNMLKKIQEEEKEIEEEIQKEIEEEKEEEEMKEEEEIEEEEMQKKGGANKFKKTENKITVIYEKKKYIRVIYISERKKYVKINKVFMLLSKLKKV
jgi:hypothetical protein